jgi:hypothetical protein
MAAKAPAADAKGKKALNPMAEAANWNARCITEEEAPHKWNEAWGQMFSGGIPHDYAERIAYLERELKGCPPLETPPKYGCGPAFVEPVKRTKKQPSDGKLTWTNEELDAYNEENKRAR